MAYLPLKALPTDRIYQLNYLMEKSLKKSGIAVNYTGTQSLFIFVVGFKHWVQAIIIIYMVNHFVFHHWECTSIYYSLSYLFSSLIFLTEYFSVPKMNVMK